MEVLFDDRTIRSLSYTRPVQVGLRKYLPIKKSLASFLGEHRTNLFCDRVHLKWLCQDLHIFAEVTTFEDCMLFFSRGTEPMGVRTKTWTTKEVVHVFLRRQTSSG